MVCNVGRSPIVIVIEVATEAGANFSQIKQAPGGDGRFPCLLDGWRQDRRQDRNDGYDYQQFNQRKAPGQAYEGIGYHPLSTA